MRKNKKAKWIAEETLIICNDKRYILNKGIIDLEPSINSCIENTYVFDKEPEILDSNEIKRLNSEPFKLSNSIKVVNNSLDKSINKWSKSGRKVLVLNQASPKDPGGGFIAGYDGQEESLTRSSTLYTSLSTKIDDFYNFNKIDENRGLYYNAGIYSPNVSIIRDMTMFFEPLIFPYDLDIISCPSVNRKIALKNKVSEGEIVLNMINRIDLIIDGFCNQMDKHNYQSPVLILGDFGCGYCKHNPEMISELFKLVLNKYNEDLLSRDVAIEFAIKEENSFNIFTNIFKIRD